MSTAPIWGQTIVREGDAANLFFIVARGTVTIQLRVPSGDGERIVRIASLGPGVSFGEMALLDGGPAPPTSSPTSGWSVTASRSTR